MNKDCAICGNVFKVKPSHFCKRITCSRECSGKYNSIHNVGKNNPNWRSGISKKESKCMECGKDFIKPSYFPGKFCSRLCHNRNNAKAKRELAIKNGYKIQVYVKRDRKPAKKWFCTDCGNLVGRKVMRCRDCIKTKTRSFNCIKCGKEKTVAHYSPVKSYCSHRCVNADQIGVKNPNYRGGITPENNRLRRSDEYKQWRISVFERDNYTCVNCGQVGGELNADHIKQWAFYPELRFEINNGRTLCKPCHEKTPTYMKGKRKILETIIPQ